MPIKFRTQETYTVARILATGRTRSFSYEAIKDLPTTPPSEPELLPVDSQGGTYFPLRNTTTDPVSPEYTAQSYTFIPNDGLYFDNYLANAYKLFANNTTFVGDPDMALWDVSRIHSMNRMFYGASAFNTDLGSWDTSYVSNFYWTFKDATSFNQDLSQWDVTRDAGHGGFSDGSALTPVHLPPFT